MTKKHVFLSYVRENEPDVEVLRNDLIGLGEAVWWDQDIPVGAKWKLEIRKALKRRVCLRALSLKVIVTENVRDFPERALSVHGIVAQSTDEFVAKLIESAPEQVAEIVEKQAADLQKPAPE